MAGGIGVGQYANAFEVNEIGMDLLGQVDDRMLKDIGVSIGGGHLGRSCPGERLSCLRAMWGASELR